MTATFVYGCTTHSYFAMSKLSQNTWLGFNIVLLSVIIKESWSLASQSPLCESMDMPCKREHPETCHMKYYKLNSTECRDLTFDEKLPSNSVTSESIGRVELKSFYYKYLSYKMTAFNVTFLNIKWKHLKFRFRQIGNDMKNTCREFFILTNATVNDMFYDCIWSNETYEGKPFFFEYEASNESDRIYKKFSFHVPLAKNVDETLTNVEKWETFIYTEAVSMSSGLGPTKFYVYWQPLPKKFSVDTYNITVMSNDSGTPQLVHALNVTCSSTIECNYTYSKWYGSLQFRVQPICKHNVSCFTTNTLFFQVGGETTKPILLGIIFATCIAPFAFYFIYLLRKYKAEKKVTILKTVPKLLVIYSRGVQSHVNVVLAMVEYFKSHCGIEPLLDELHIFLSKSRDPFKWCNQSLKSADCVMVVASPHCKFKDTSDSVYRNTDLLLLRLLRERLSSSRSKTKFFVLMLPYTLDGDVPQEADNLRRFHFPRDLNKLLKFIHEKPSLSNLFGQRVPGGKEDYKLYGKKLSCAIEEAQHYLKKMKKKRKRMERNVDLEQSAREEDEDYDYDNNGEVDSDHEWLTMKKRIPLDVINNVTSKTKKESLREMARESFLNYPGHIESINLLGRDGEGIDEPVDLALQQPAGVNVNELNL